MLSSSPLARTSLQEEGNYGLRLGEICQSLGQGACLDSGYDGCLLLESAADCGRSFRFQGT